MRLPTTSDPLPAPIEDHWTDFRRSLRLRNRSNETAAVYRTSFTMFWKWALDQGIDEPDQVDHRVINDWTEALLSTQVVRNGRAMFDLDPRDGTRQPRLLSSTTRQIRYKNLRPFFSWWAKEFDTTNPFDKAEVPGEARPTPIPVLRIDDVRALLATCKGTDLTDRRDNAIIRVLFDTGARLGELVSLTLESWDPRTDRLTLEGKSGTRVVPLSPSTAQALSRYLRVRKEHPQTAVARLWLGKKGALGASGIAQLLDRRCSEAGVPHINPHRFRHTWAHMFRAKGGDEGDLLHLAGWSSPAMAHRYGRSAAAERAQHTAERLRLGDEL